jgi:hypothetical protein
VFVAEDRSVKLGLRRLSKRVDLLFGFGRQIGLQRLDVLSDARLNPVYETYRLAVLAIRVFVI